MTSTGFLVGVLAGIGILAIGVVILVVILVRKISKMTDEDGPPSQGTGFSKFKKRVASNLISAPVNSSISAEFPIPSVTLLIKVSGKKAGVNSYQLEVRLGYKRLDHLELVEATLEKQSLKFERIDKGNGAIKIISEKVGMTEELLEICDSLRTAIMFDLGDNSIKIWESIRKG